MSRFKSNYWYLYFRIGRYEFRLSNMRPVKVLYNNYRSFGCFHLLQWHRDYLEGEPFIAAGWM